MKLNDRFNRPSAEQQSLPPQAQGQFVAHDERTPGHDITTNVPRRTLLYLEDNPANLRLVNELITLIPHVEMIGAVNGTLGIELARATQPRVILMHISRPGIIGIRALKILRQDANTAHIPVVALSADVIPCDIYKTSEAGFFRQLTKPIKVEEFMSTLNAALNFVEIRLPTAQGASQTS